jgi:hypothetical protein
MVESAGMRLCINWILFLPLAIIFTACEVLPQADSNSSDIPEEKVYDIVATPNLIDSIEGIPAYTSFKTKDQDGKIIDISHLAVPITASGVVATKINRNNQTSWKIESFYEIETKLIWTFPELNMATVELPLQFRKANILSVTAKGCDSEAIAGFEYFPSLTATLNNGRTSDVTSSALWSVESGHQYVDFRPSAVPSFRTLDQGHFVLRAEIGKEVVRLHCAVGDAMITKLEIFANSSLKNGVHEVFSGTTLRLESKLTFSNDRVIINDPRVVWSSGAFLHNGVAYFTPTSLSGVHKDFTVRASLQPGTAYGIESNILNIRAKTVKPIALELTFNNNNVITSSLVGSNPYKMYVGKEEYLQFRVKHNDGSNSPVAWNQLSRSSYSRLEFKPGYYNDYIAKVMPKLNGDVKIGLSSLPDHEIVITVDNTIPSTSTNGSFDARFPGLQNSEPLKLVDYDGTVRLPNSEETVSFSPAGFVKLENGKVSFLENSSKLNTSVQVRVSSPRYGLRHLGYVSWCPKPSSLAERPSFSTSTTYAANPINFNNRFQAIYPSGTEWDRARSFCNFIPNQHLRFSSEKVDVTNGCINYTTESATIEATLMPGVSGTANIPLAYYPSIESLKLNGTELGIKTGTHKITISRDKILSYNYPRLNFEAYGMVGYRSPRLRVFDIIPYSDPSPISNPVTRLAQLKKGFLVEISGSSPLDETPCHTLRSAPHSNQKSPMEHPHFIEHISTSSWSGTTKLGLIQHLHRAKFLFCGPYIGRDCDTITPYEFEVLESRSRGVPFLGSANFIVEVN